MLLQVLQLDVSRPTRPRPPGVVVGETLLVVAGSEVVLVVGRAVVQF